MRRCGNCRHDNVDDAVTCSQCGRPLTSDGDASAEHSEGARDGVHRAELVTPVAGNGSGSAASSATDGLSAGNAIDRAATVTVEVRRTRVSLLASGRFAAAPVATPAPMATQEAAAAPRTARSRRRWLLALAVLVIVIIGAVIYLLLAHLS